MPGRFAFLLPVVTLVLACGEGPGSDGAKLDGDDAGCSDALELEFQPDTLGADEAYVCFGFDSTTLSDASVSAVRWSIPDEGEYVLHHAILYAIPEDFPDGPIVCDAMPDAAVGLHVWSIGGDDLVLPSDAGLLLPAGTVRFVVEAHTLRAGGASGEPARARICRGPAEPVHLAALMGLNAPVPAIRPMHEEISEKTCALSGDFHFFSVWPHMHRVGREISADLERVGGDTMRLVGVTDWDFGQQRTYPLDVDAVAGDQVRIRCVWENPTPEYVLPGPRSEDEMCNAVFIGWPAGLASCN
jgi:hypothetical protein